jgi:hypothetical protein
MPKLTELESVIARVVEAAQRHCFDNIYASEQSLRDLWNEICSFRILVSNGARFLPDLGCFEHQDAARSVGFVHSACKTFLELECEIEEIVHGLQNSGVRQIPDKRACQRYCERLRQDRLALKSALDRLQMFV